MRGAYYVATALLVAVSTQQTPKSEKADLTRPKQNVVVPSNTKRLLKKLLRGTHDLQDDLTLSAVNEERMLKPNGFVQIKNFGGLEKLAAEAGSLLPLEKQVASVLRHRLRTNENSQVLVNAAKFLVREYSTPSSGSPTVITADSLHSEQGFNRKTDFLENSRSAYQLQNSLTRKENDWLSLSLDGPSGNNNFIEKSHSAGKSSKRKKSDWLSLSVGGQSGHTVILEDSQTAGQQPNPLTRRENDWSSLSLDDYGSQTSKRQKIEELPSISDEKMLNIFIRFRTETNVPFELNKVEMREMLDRVNDERLSSPTDTRHRKFIMMVNRMTLAELQTSLSTKAFIAFFGKHWKKLHINEKSLREACILKMVIIYDLFYSFCHNSGNSVSLRRHPDK